MATFEWGTWRRLIGLAASATALGCSADGGSGCGTGSDCASASNGPNVDEVIEVSSGGASASDVSGNCAEAKVEFEAQVPQMWLLIDRSHSMVFSLQGGYEDSNSRWVALRRVLLGDSAAASDRGVVGEFDAKVSFGAAFYTQRAGAGGCEVDLTAVPLAAKNYEGIRAQYDALTPGDGTPTAEAFQLLAKEASAVPATGQKVIILATDGEPNVCGLEGTAETNVETAVSEAFQQGILTVLVFIGPELGPAHLTHLQRVANLGLGKAADSPDAAPYYTSQDEQGLRDAFTSIVSGFQGCSFALNGEVKSESASRGTVTLDGTPLLFEGIDGWRLTAPSQVELLGAACDQVRAGSKLLDIQFPCDVYTLVAW